MGKKQHKHQAFLLLEETPYDLRKELEVKKQELQDAYILANQDIGQIETMGEWRETLSDGIDG